MLWGSECSINRYFEKGKKKSGCGEKFDFEMEKFIILFRGFFSL